MTGPRQKLLFVFLDGVGLGDRSGTNPFATAGTPQLHGLLAASLDSSLPDRDADGIVTRRLDARLGVTGLPQSATGQATLLTGHNAAALMGRHYGPWPGPTLQRLLDEGNLFSQVTAAGGQAGIANLYPPPYFEALEQKKSRVNVPVHAALTAGLQLREFADFERGNAISADMTGRFLQRFSPGSGVLSPAASGSKLRALALQQDFTFFDFWLSDHIGHRGSMAEAEELVRNLDAFLAAVLAPRADGLTVLVTSDHGNLEDKSLRTHTLNPVPLLASGEQAREFAEVGDLTGVAPAIRRILGL